MSEVAPARPHPPPAGRVPILDGLRGFAVAVVVLFHVWQISWIDYSALFHAPFDLSFFPATGFVGVDVFFFLSAFCLTLPYVRCWLTGTPAPTLRHFVHRRVLKIVPSYYLAVGLMLCLLPQPGIAPGREWFHLLTHLCFIHNWFFETGGSIAGVLWSLATEVQFYAVFPLLMLALRRSPVVTIAGMVAVAVVWRVICLRILFVADGGEALLAWRGEQLPARLDIFAAGMAAAYAHVWARQNAPHRKWFAPGLAGVALLAFAALVWQMQTYYGVSRAGTPVDVVAMRGRLLLAATLFVLGFGGSLAPHRFQQAAANPVLSLLSQVSYNLYLWHQPLALWLLSHHLPPTQTPDPHGDPVWQWRFTLLAWAVGIVVAAVLTVGWETPFLRGKLPGFGRKR